MMGMIPVGNAIHTMGIVGCAIGASLNTAIVKKTSSAFPAGMEEALNLLRRTKKAEYMRCFPPQPNGLKSL